GDIMLMEELFSRGIMTIGASPIDPGRQIGVFNQAALAGFPAARAAEMQKFRWLAGEWHHENEVPATRFSPAYTDVGTGRFSFCEKDNWICAVGPDGRETPHITFDPFSKQWIYLLIRGSYGVLRSAEGWIGNQIVFTGLLTMIGINCEWRMTWTKSSDDAFGFINEERMSDGSWSYIDKWTLTR